jgi:uncharacterized membrane protein
MHHPGLDETDPPPTEHARPLAAPRRTDDPVAAALSGSGLAAAGLALIFVGCAFFFDLAFTRGWIPPAARLAIGFAAGIAILTVATRFLRGTYRLVAAGGVALGAGVLYLTAWAAIAVFPDLHVPRAIAFAVMVAITAVLTLLANRERAQPIAVMGLVGAYLTPVLLTAGSVDRFLLAPYLLIVTSGMLVLARVRAFLAIEVMAIAATLVSAIWFVPDAASGWSAIDAAAVATAFFIMLETAFALRPVDGTHRVLQLLPSVVTGATYIGLVEYLLADRPRLLSIALLCSAAAFAASPRIRRFALELKPAYGGLALLALNLGLRSLLHRTELLGALSIEAALLCVIGRRSAETILGYLGVALFAFAGGGLVWQAVMLPPALTLFTPLALSFALWAQGAYSARRAIPAELGPLCPILAHVVVLVAITRGALDATGGPSWSDTLPNMAQATISLCWALAAALLFIRSVQTRNGVERWEALVLFTLTIGKAFTVDLAYLDLAYRVPAFIAIGGVLFASSTWYTRSIAVRAKQLGSNEPTRAPQAVTSMP